MPEYIRSLLYSMFLAYVLEQTHGMFSSALLSQTSKGAALKSSIKAPRFPSLVTVNENCNGVLLPNYIFKSNMKQSTSSKFLVTPFSCVHGVWCDYGICVISHDTVKFGSSGTHLSQRKTILYSSNNDAVNIAVVMLEKPLPSDDEIHSVALPASFTLPDAKHCKVIGLSDEIPTKLILTNVKDISFDAKCSTGMKENFEETHKMCLTTNEPFCQLKTGSALVCSVTESKSDRAVWTLYGLQIDNSQCGRAQFVYTKIDHVLKFWIKEVVNQTETKNRLPNDDPLKTALLWPPKGKASDDEAGKMILKFGQIFKAPQYYDLNPIKRPRLAISGSNLLDVEISGDGGFHFADVLGYGTTESNNHCMLICLHIKRCYAVNYVDGNHWCVLLATANKQLDIVGLWRGEDYGFPMQHLTFREGNKAHPPSHKPRTDPISKPLPAGTSPRLTSRSRIFNGRASEMYKYPWMAKIGGCGASLINEDLSNGKSTSSSLLVTAAHCIQNITTGILADVVARLGAYRADMLQDVENDIPLVKAIVHNEFENGMGGWSDIALVQMQRPVKFNSYIGPVAFPSLNSFPSKPKQCRAIGWGATDAAGDPRTLNEISVEAFSAEKCRTYHKVDDHSEIETYARKRVFCAAAEKHGRMVSVCNGDSGGPLFCSEMIGGQRVQVIYGVASYVFTCDSMYPPVFTNVSSLMDWLGKAVSEIKNVKAMTVARLSK